MTSHRTLFASGGPLRRTLSRGPALRRPGRGAFLVGLLAATLAGAALAWSDEPASPIKPGAARSAARQEKDAKAEKSAAERDARGEKERAERERLERERAGKALLKKSTRSNLPAFTAEREAAALVFVGREHPELAQLLGQLRAARPEEYEAAVRELFRTSETLADLKETDGELYELQLQGWRLQSRIQILLARYGMSPTPEMKEQIRAALVEQTAVRTARARREVAAAQIRLGKAEQLLRSLESRGAVETERELEMLLRRFQAGKEPGAGKEPIKADASAESE